MSLGACIQGRSVEWEEPWMPMISRSIVERSHRYYLWLLADFFTDNVHLFSKVRIFDAHVQPAGSDADVDDRAFRLIRPGFIARGYT